MIAWEEHGAGPVVLFVHGVGLDRSMWEQCLPSMASAGYRSVLVDLPGHGGSPPLSEEPTLANMAAAVASVPFHPVHLVGFSIGAFIATEMTAAQPSRVRSLCLVSAVARRTEVERRTVLQRLQQVTSDFEGTLDQTVDRWFSPEWSRREPEVRDRVRRLLLDNDPESYAACYRLFALADADAWDRLPAIPTPTLAVTGSDDLGSTPDMTFAIAEHMPRCRGVTVPDARHLLPLEQPGALMEAVTAHLDAAEQPPAL